MNIIDAIVPEYQHEMAVTRTVLERVPDAHWGWKPHPKSMTMGVLASHLAEMQWWAIGTMKDDVWVMDMATYKPFVAANTAEALAAFDQNVADAVAAMTGASNEHMLRTWSMKTPDGNVMMAMPRVAVIRAFVLSHTVHHRGQLTVYLRMNDVPLPQVYGPSADAPGMMG
ncbi:MAG: damage-inducible protein DinB [Candidatus Hydrogenedentes bacterium]|nr:damage-inducible protein DinB [Candidatus Hydrogenedentota bacterium]